MSGALLCTVVMKVWTKARDLQSSAVPTFDPLAVASSSECYSFKLLWPDAFVAFSPVT